MRASQVIRILPVLPAAWLSSKIYEKKSTEQSQVRLEKWSKDALQILGYDLHVQGIENVPLNETIYFVSNHQGTMDPALILASCPVHLAFISKKENEKIPLFGRWATNIGTIHFDRESREGNVHMLREAARELKKGHNLLIFPEGTRSKGDAMNPFKAGALKPAYLAKATIVPIALQKSYVLDIKGDKTKHIGIVYGKPIRPEEYKQTDSEVLAKDIQNWIKRQVKRF